MRHSTVAALAPLLLFLPSATMACRHPPEPQDLGDDPADAIVLATIKDVRATTGKQWSSWAATATVTEPLWGRIPESEIELTDEGPGSCQIIGKPRLGKYHVLYLRRHDRGTHVNAMPFWWAWRSGDARLAKLMKLFPLGPVREPTAEEARLLDLAEPRVKLPDAETSLAGYTRIYARSSAGSVRVAFFRSRTPQRLMLDYTEEMPTRQSCDCDLRSQHVELQDLWEAGKLPEFKP